MFVGEFADPKKNDVVIDVCAAPGGKSIHVAEKLEGTGHVEARDLTPYKVGMIEENIERTGLCNIESRCWDALVYEEASRERADIVIADLPCSGIGSFWKENGSEVQSNKAGDGRIGTVAAQDTGRRPSICKTRR